MKLGKIIKELLARKKELLERIKEFEAKQNESYYKDPAAYKKRLDWWFSLLPIMMFIFIVVWVF